MAYDKENRVEILDKTPVAIPVGYKKPEPLHDILNRLVSQKFSQLLLDSETETFEEADDFDCDDDFDPYSPWEEIYDNGESIGFLEQNRNTPPKNYGGSYYERRPDDRKTSYIDYKDSNSSNRSDENNTSRSDSERSE